MSDHNPWKNAYGELTTGLPSKIGYTGILILTRSDSTVTMAKVEGAQ